MVLKAIIKLFTSIHITNKNPATFIVKPLLRTCSCQHQISSVKFSNLRSVSAIIKVQHAPKAENKVNNLQNKAKIISSLNFKSSKDAEPFYQLSLQTLSFIRKVTSNDKKNGYCDNRLYYISSKIQCPPAVVSEKLAKRIFVYRLSFDWLEKSLDELLEKGVTGDRLIRDLWVLKYHHLTIRERLQSIQDRGIDKMYPWMVRCSQSVLDRYMNISKETKQILGDTQSTQMYLANRLNISLDDVEDICMKIPALKTIRVTKVKKFLDFLIDAGYDVEEIANKPRILASSQKTVKHRLEELQQLGLKHVNLNVLCRSRKDYRRFRDSFDTD